MGENLIHDWHKDKYGRDSFETDEYLVQMVPSNGNCFITIKHRDGLPWQDVGVFHANGLSKKNMEDIVHAMKCAADHSNREVEYYKPNEQHTIKN